MRSRLPLKPILSLILLLHSLAISAADIPAGNAETAKHGQFGPVFGWPLIPIAMTLLPDGRVLGYGTDNRGAQGAQIIYAVWDPGLGFGANAMTLLPNRTGTDLFCAGQALLPSSGDVLLIGGDRTVNGLRNYANNKVNTFVSGSSTLEQQPQSMSYQRWYASVIGTNNGEQVILGGRDDRTYADGVGDASTLSTYSITPEVRGVDGSWRTLANAASDAAYGSEARAWNYPKAWMMSNGLIDIITPNGKVFSLDSSGSGTLKQLPGLIPRGYSYYPGAMYGPDKIIIVRRNLTAAQVDLHSGRPVVTTSSMLYDHYLGNGTLLPDGSFWVNGGGTGDNTIEAATYTSEMWSPQTGSWTAMASNSIPRLYHSTALLLPDATVLTAGGGAPGPVRNLNGEIYYPPYLYAADGSPASRPVITGGDNYVKPGTSFTLTVAPATTVTRVSLIRLGSTTHTFNNDQRFIELSFSQNGDQLSVNAPATSSIAPPGFYMAFILNAAGTPSVAKIIRIAMN